MSGLSGGRQLKDIELLALCLIDEARNRPRYTAIDLKEEMKPHPAGESLDLLEASKMVRPKQTVGGTPLTGTLSLTPDARVMAGRDFDAVLSDLDYRIAECEGRSESSKEKKDKGSAIDFEKAAKFWAALKKRLEPYRDRMVAFHQRAKATEAELEKTPEPDASEPTTVDGTGPKAGEPEKTTTPDPRLSRKAQGKNAA